MNNSLLAYYSYIGLLAVLVFICEGYVNSVDGIRRLEKRLKKMAAEDERRRDAIWTRWAESVANRGKKAEKRVVYGTPMEHNQWPWLVSLHFLRPFAFTEKTGMKHVCGGTIISSDPVWVITAGHCFSEDVYEEFSNPDNWEVVINEYNQYQQEPNQIKAHIDEIHLRNFSAITLLNDIALLKLRPIPQLQLEDVADLDEGEFNTGQRCSIAGWGQVSYRPYGLGNFIPLIASVSLIDNDRCSELYSAAKTFTFYIDQSTICAGSQEGHDACLGDSGGPLMCQSSEDDRWKLVGIVSVGNECGMKDFPGIYTRVTYYRDWISRVMQPPNGHVEV